MMMDKKAQDLVEGFFNPMDLLDKNELFKRLRNMEPGNLFDVMESIRRDEIKKLRETGFWESNLQHIHQNLKHFDMENVFPKDQLVEFIQYLMSTSSLWPAYFMIMSHDDRFISEHVTIRNIEYLDQALIDGNGAILGQLHWGPFQLLFPLLVKLGYPIFQLFGEKDAEIWAVDMIKAYFPENLWSNFKTATVPESGFLVKALKALKRNSFVALPLEVNGSDILPRQTLQFLGNEIYAPDGSASIAAITKSPIILVRVEAVRDQVEIIFDEPIYIHHKKDVAEVNKRIFNKMEYHIKENPLQWRGWAFLEEMVVQKEMSK